MIKAKFKWQYKWKLILCIYLILCTFLMFTYGMHWIPSIIMFIFLPLLEFILFFLPPKKTSSISYTCSVVLEKLIAFLKKGNERKKQVSTKKLQINKLKISSSFCLVSPKDHLPSDYVFLCFISAPLCACLHFFLPLLSP